MGCCDNEISAGVASLTHPWSIYVHYFHISVYIWADVVFDWILELTWLTCVSASARSFWLIPQRLATLSWHLWWTFIAQSTNTHTHTQEWIKQLKLVHPNPEKVVAPHLHTWGPVWPDPTADSRSGRRRWDSCSCATWSGAACRFWSAPSGTAGTNTNAPICMNARSAAPSVPAALSVAFLQFILTEEDHCCICSEPMRLHPIYYPLYRRLPARLFTYDHHPTPTTNLMRLPYVCIWQSRDAAQPFHNTDAAGVSLGFVTWSLMIIICQ